MVNTLTLTYTHARTRSNGIWPASVIYGTLLSSSSSSAAAAATTTTAVDKVQWWRRTVGGSDGGGGVASAAAARERERIVRGGGDYAPPKKVMSESRVCVYVCEFRGGGVGGELSARVWRRRGAECARFSPGPTFNGDGGATRDNSRRSRRPVCTLRIFPRRNSSFFRSVRFSPYGKRRPQCSCTVG